MDVTYFFHICCLQFMIVLKSIQHRMNMEIHTPETVYYSQNFTYKVVIFFESSSNVSNSKNAGEHD